MGIPAVFPGHAGSSRGPWQERLEGQSYAGRQGDGRRVYVTRTIHGTKRFAEGKLAELLMEVGHTDEVTTDGTLADLVQQWRPIAQVNLSPTTLHEYDRLLEKRILPRFGGTKVRSIRAADIDGFYADLQRRGRADGGPLGAEHPTRPRPPPQIVESGRPLGMDCDRPGDAWASSPRVHRHELAIPKPEVVAKPINRAEETQRFRFLPSVGRCDRCAEGELCALRWTDIDMKAATVRIARSVVGDERPAGREEHKDPRQPAHLSGPGDPQQPRGATPAK